jgi:peptide/nickel transport system ATP-binding protein
MSVTFRKPTGSEEVPELPSNASAPPLLAVEGLTIDYLRDGVWDNAVNDISFSVGVGEVFGLVGESGCGKTTVLRSLLGYRHPASRIRDGTVIMRDQDILAMSQRELRGIRGRHIAYVPQNPTTSLSPGMRVGNQVMETLRAHGLFSARGEAFERTLSLFDQVGLPDREATARKYPHQLSGGQQQRVVIAMALACEPDLLLLDEPTTGLDVTTQARILSLVARLRAEIGISMVYVTHNLAVIANICDRIGVMYAGDLVEEADTRQIFAHPAHPYTSGLIASIPGITDRGSRVSTGLRGMLQRELLPPAGCKFAPRCDFVQERCRTNTQELSVVSNGHRVACWRSPELELSADGTVTRSNSDDRESVEVEPGPKKNDGARIEFRNLECAYQWERGRFLLGRRPIPVVSGVSFNIEPGETVGLVGESGSGKSTIAKAITGLLVPTSGEIILDGEPVPRSAKRRPRNLLRRIQLVMQNPDASLNPRQRVETIVGRPLRLFFGLSRNELRTKVLKLLEDVHLDHTYLRRFPGEMSGGERQRVAIARALAAEPEILLCDEIVSALDVSVQAEVLALLRTAQTDQNLGILFISHDLAVIRSVSHRVVVLYGGELMEIGNTDEVYSPPYHPYTHVLLSAVPDIDPDKPIATVQGGIEEEFITETNPACAFAKTCPWNLGAICNDVVPPRRKVSESHEVRCHIPLEDLYEKEKTLGESIAGHRSGQ